jgi:hypothetical protein
MFNKELNRLVEDFIVKFNNEISNSTHNAPWSTKNKQWWYGEEGWWIKQKGSREWRKKGR